MSLARSLEESVFEPRHRARGEICGNDNVLDFIVPRCGHQRRSWALRRTKDQKIIKGEVGLLELARQLGNVSQACKMLGYRQDSIYRFKELYESLRPEEYASGGFRTA